MKKEWTKPKLIVLFRGRPEEAVLVACKDGGGADVDQTQTNCNDSGCADCDGIVGS